MMKVTDGDYSVMIKVTDGDYSVMIKVTDGGGCDDFSDRWWWL